jgi:hypothetical protein
MYLNSNGGLSLCLAIGGGALLWFHHEESELMAHCNVKPQKITAAQLAKNGPGKNWHVLLTRYRMANPSVRTVKTKNTARTYELSLDLIPVDKVTAGKKLRLDYGSIKGQEEIPSIMGRPTLEAVAIPRGNQIDVQIRALPTGNPKWMQDWGLGLLGVGVLGTLFGIKPGQRENPYD